MDDIDPESVKAQISAPPFVIIDGVSNVRTLGDYSSTTYPRHLTKSNFAFRAAEVSGITELGKAQLASLGIKKVFDLRSDSELEKFGAPVPELMSHIEIVRVPVFKKEDYSPEMVARRYRLYASGKIEAFMELYSQILDNALMAYGTIFKHIRDKPNEAFLFHCTAGKDRTGVLAALILKLAGVDNETIAKDYSLTLVGRALQREMIMKRLSKEPIFAGNKEAAFNLLGSRHETMIAFLSMLEEKYGGTQKYLSEYLGFSEDDITMIRHNIVVEKTF